MEKYLYGYNDNDFAYCIRQTSDTGYVLIGIRDNYNLGDINIVKTDKTGYANPPVSINSNAIEYLNTYQLFQNFPNPFNPKTKISFELKENNNMFVSLKVFDILGNEAAVLVIEKQNGGKYSVEFDGTDFSSGIYFCQLKTNNFMATIRMLLIK